MIIDFDSKNKGGGKEPVVEALNVTANGSYNAPSGVDGYNPVEVNVPQREPVLESLSVTDNGNYTPSAGKDGFDSVEVNVPKEHHNVTSKSITANGTYNSTGDEVWNSVDVNVPERQPVLESLSVNANGTYNAPSNIDGYNSVEVNVPQSGGTGFDLSQLRTVKFSGNLQTIDLSGLDTSNFDDMSEMFRNCRSLTSLDLSSFNTSKVTSMDSMFYGCSSLTTLDISGWSFEKYASWSNFSLFYGNVSLTTIISDNLRLPDRDLSSIGLNSSPLTVDSIVGLLNALPTTTNGYSFQIGETNINKLSEEQKSIATSKGWTLI